MDEMREGLLGGAVEEARLGRMEELLNGMEEGALDGLTVGRRREGVQVEVGQLEEDLPVLIVTTFSSMLCSIIDSIDRLSLDAVNSSALLSVVCVLASCPTTSSCL